MRFLLTFCRPPGLLCLAFLFFQFPLLLSAQNFQWALNPGASTHFERGWHCASDAYGNLYLSGDFNQTVDFDPGPGVANLVSKGGQDVFLASFDSAGTYRWAIGLGSSQSSEIGYGVASSLDGGVFLVGSFHDTIDCDPGAGTANLVSAGFRDGFIAHYDSLGNYQWAFSIGSTNYDECFGVTVDAGGNVYLTGSFRGTVDFDPGAGVTNLTASVADIFVAKYDGNGNLVWAINPAGAGPSPGGARDVEVDAFGNVIITGEFSGTVDFDPGAGVAALIANTTKPFVAKYDSSGNYAWAFILDGTTSFMRGHAVTTDELGNVYATGYYAGTTDFDPGPGTANLVSTLVGEFYLAKYSPAGNYQWAFDLTSNNNSDNQGRGLAYDGNGNVLVSGIFTADADFDPGPGTATLTVAISSSFLAAYDTAGNYLWAIDTDGSASGAGFDLSLDGMGNVYQCGFFSGTTDFDPGPGTSQLTSTFNDYYLVKYGFCGNSQAATAPVLNLNNTTICPGENVNLSVTGGSLNGNMQWELFDGGCGGNLLGQDPTGNFTLSPATTTTYFVRGAGGCAPDGLCDSIQVMIATAFNIFDTLSICKGDSVLLSGGWQTVAGDYIDSLQSSAGCDSVVSTNLSVQVVDTAVTVAGSTLTATGAAAAYQWLDCTTGNLVPGATSAAFTPAFSGSYAVIISDASCNDTSACFSVIITGVMENALHPEVRVYPVPARQEVTLECALATEFTVQMYDFAGRECHNARAESGKVRLDLSGFAPGIYTYRLATAPGRNLFGKIMRIP